MKYSVPFFMGNRVQGLDVPQPHTAIEPDLAAGSEMERMAVLYRHVADAVDVVDPKEVPAVSYPAPGGPSTETVAEAVAELEATGNVAAFSLTTWNPALDGAVPAAAAGERIAAPFLG